MKSELALSKVEKDVENVYREAIRNRRSKATITSPFNTDGYAKWGSVRLLLEAKYKQDLKARKPVCNTLGQCLLYVKRFEKSGEPLPNVILVGDRNECFVLSTESVRGFLGLPIDWDVAPSDGSPVLTQALVDGLNILPFVYAMDDDLKFSDVLQHVESLASGKQHSVRASVSNLESIFVYWRDRVFKASGLTPVEQVDIFLKCLFAPADVYPHPSKKGLLVVPGYQDGVPFSVEQFLSFFSFYVQGYKPTEIAKLYAIKDRLVEDGTRRRQGAFFTPTIWVNEAHKMISSALGESWREECIVWDPAAGTGNLTRDYEFNDLIISTLEHSDVQVIIKQGYNHSAVVCQHDFLNPGVDGALPPQIHARLKAAAKAGKRLVFFMNPPYAENGVMGATGESRPGVAVTGVNAAMRVAKIGRPAQQLYAQFMFQAVQHAEQYGFEHVTVALYSKPTFVCSGSYRAFRNLWYGRFAYHSGMMFKASHFADVSGSWGVTFTLWNEGIQDPTQALPVILKDVEQTVAVDSGLKSMYASDHRDAAIWAREPLGKVRGADAPQFSSGLVVKEGSSCHGTLIAGSVAYLESCANNLMDSGARTYLVSGPSSHAHGCSVLPGESWRRATALFAARKLVAGDWINDKDEYLVPQDSEQYRQWNDDAMIYAILHTSNNCTAMRNVSYRGASWRIKNNFWWRTIVDSKDLYDAPTCQALYADIWGEKGDSYLSTILPSLQLSPEAAECFYRLDALVVLSAPERESFAAGRPELHLLAHDAGVYQLKHLWRELFPTEWAALQISFKALSNKLRPGVYEHGFLLK